MAELRLQCKNIQKLHLRYLELCLDTCYVAGKLIGEIVVGASSSLEELTLDYGVWYDIALNDES